MPASSDDSCCCVWVVLLAGHNDCSWLVAASFAPRRVCRGQHFDQSGPAALCGYKRSISIDAHAFLHFFVRICACAAHGLGCRLHHPAALLSYMHQRPTAHAYVAGLHCVVHPGWQCAPKAASCSNLLEWHDPSVVFRSCRAWVGVVMCWLGLCVRSAAYLVLTQLAQHCCCSSDPAQVQVLLP
ncbi:hypothetical protein COO60DRAFT_419733 [Scenedesmus sp. NREL 46B-D3]|nr:hypothetical protein COO60DRAFT_419733 [Scenedesmus sp. NREL 46B-D3]